MRLNWPEPSEQFKNSFWTTAGDARELPAERTPPEFGNTQSTHALTLAASADTQHVLAVMSPVTHIQRRARPACATLNGMQRAAVMDTVLLR